MKDLTKGKPSTLILAFALPIFLGNLLQLTYSVTDTRIVGSFLGEDALAAVGATTTLSNLIIGFLLGLANGFAIITAQRFGAKDIRGVKKSFAASLVLGTVISVVLTVLGLVFLQPILRFLNVPEHLIPVAGSYIFIIIAGLLATFLYDACAAALRALGQVDLLGFVEENGGLDMEILEKGANLSGGQKQRLALARALLHDSPVYIFDEATSNVDVESENKIMEIVQDLAREKSVILISHRLANVTAADKILYMEQGKIAESGTHEQLMAQNKAYAALFNKQQELEHFREEAV